MISILFILIAIVFGMMVYRRNASLVVSTVVGVLAIVACMAIGYNWHPIYLSGSTWMIIVGIYIAIASVTPVWILLQPRDYLSSFLLYGMMIIAVVGIVGAHPTLSIPAFTGFVDNAEYGSGVSLGSLFPALFVTIGLRRNLRFPFTRWFRYDCKAAGQRGRCPSDRLRRNAD